MKTIPQETVAAAWDRMCELSDKQARDLAGRMQEEQPFLLVYLLASEDEDTADEDRGWLLELGAFVWSVMSAGKPALRAVTAEELDAAEAANAKLLAQLDDLAEAEWPDVSARLLKGYNQAPLLSCLIEVLVSEEEDSPDLAGDETGAGFLYLKTVIDCLDR